MVQKNQVEIGHFYLDELLCDIDISYLHEYTHLFDNSDLYLFLDDIHIDCIRLDYDKLKDNIETLINKKVNIVFESEMEQYFDFVKKELNLKKIKFKGKVK